MAINDQSRHVAPPSDWVDPQPPTAPMRSWRRAVPLVLWLGCLTLSLALLQALGDGRLAAPALADPGSWSRWAAGRDPVEVTMVVLRLLALGGAWYLTGVTSISVVARTLRAVRLVRVADALSVGPVRHLVQQAVGIGLAAGVLATTVPGTAAPGRAAAGARGGDVAVMTAVPAEPAGAEDGGATTDGPAGPGWGEVATSTVMVPVPALRPSAPPTPEPPTPAEREVRVRPGDHFWALAEEAVAEHLGRPGTEVEVLAQWEATVTANAERLVVAGNPDLLLPGQLIVLPDVAEVLP